MSRWEMKVAGGEAEDRPGYRPAAFPAVILRVLPSFDLTNGQREVRVMAVRSGISTLNHDGTEVMGPGILMYHYPGNDIVNGSLLTVESNHFCVLKSRGAVLNVYETGQYALTTPDKPLLGSIAQGFFGGSSPWVYELIYVNRSKLLIRSEGVATSEEMAEMAYQA